MRILVGYIIFPILFATLLVTVFWNWACLILGVIFLFIALADAPADALFKIRLRYFIIGAFFLLWGLIFEMKGQNIPKYYIQSGPTFSVIVSSSDAQKALYEAFMRIHKKDILPDLGDSTYIGERGFPMNVELNYIRNEMDVFAVKTLDILKATGLNKIYFRQGMPPPKNMPPTDENPYSDEFPDEPESEFGDPNNN